MEWVVLIALVVGLNVVFVLRNPMARFWRFAGKHPEAVLERMRASEAWVIFEEGLPGDFRNKWTKEHWVGPFRLDLKQPRRRVLVLGRIPGYKESAAHIMTELAGGPARD